MRSTSSVVPIAEFAIICSITAYESTTSEAVVVFQRKRANQRCSLLAFQLEYHRLTFSTDMKDENMQMIVSKRFNPAFEVFMDGKCERQ